MITTQIKIINKLGLHARASAKLVATASRFQSTIEVSLDNRTVNGKSIMGVMTLAASFGKEITLSVSGPDENEAHHALVQLIEDRFGEGE